MSDVDWRVYKYPLPLTDIAGITMPSGARVLCVQTQDGLPFIWAQVSPAAPPVERHFLVVGTGHPMPGNAGRYVGTFQMRGGALVFHVFELY